MKNDHDNRAEQAQKTLTRLGQDINLSQKIAFILEIDKLKQVWRQTLLLDKSRKENDAEHSWQLAMMALVLSDYAPQNVDLSRVVSMVLLHDIVEIDAGDSPAFTGVSEADQAARENKAADRLFTLLPDDIGTRFRALWDEFEEKSTPDALFARAMDRLQPLLHNYFTDGEMWIKHKITADQVRDRSAIAVKGAPKLNTLISDLINDAVNKGYLRP